MKKYLILDFMGVVFPEPRILSRRVHELAGKKMPYEEVRKITVLYEVGAISRNAFWKNLGVKNFKQKEKNLLDSIKPAKDFFVLRELKKRFYLCALSNIPKEWGKYLVKKHKLGKYFKEIALSGEYKLMKPDAMIYYKLMKKVRASGRQCVFLDDRLVNLETAKDLGMKTIWVKKEKKNYFFKPSAEIKNLGELESALKRVGFWQ